MDTRLPPLPQSDAESMQRNRYNSFYKVGAKDFWGQAEISHHTIEEFKECTHNFIRETDEIRCTYCHMGWLAPHDLEAIEGKLYLRNEHVQF